MLDFLGIRARRELAQLRRRLVQAQLEKTLLEERLRDCMQALAQSRDQEHRLTQHEVGLETDLQHAKADVGRLQLAMAKLEKEKRA